MRWPNATALPPAALSRARNGAYEREMGGGLAGKSAQPAALAGETVTQSRQAGTGTAGAAIRMPIDTQPP